MKRAKPLTRQDKKAVYKTADCYLRRKQEKVRHEKADKLNEEMKRDR